MIGNPTKKSENKLHVKKALTKFFGSKTVVLLTIAMLVRFSIAPLTEQRYDMYIWRLNQALIYEYRINPLNPPTTIDRNATIFFWSYPPLWLVCLLTIYPVYALISQPAYPANVNILWQNMYVTNNPSEAYHSFIPENLPLLDFLIKTPLIISDLLIGLLLFKIIKKFGKEERAQRYLCMWIFNPYVIFISAVWGMFDSLPTLFTLLAVWLFLEEKYEKSAISLAVATLFKIYPIIFAPIFVLSYYKRGGKTVDAIKYFMVTLGLIFLVMFLFNFCFALIFGQEPFNTSITLIWQLFKGRASPDWYGSNIFFGLTPLAVLSNVFKELKIEANIPISPILLGFAIVALLFKISREKNLNSIKLFSYIAAAHLIIYLTYTVVNEQYLVWVLPFLLVLSAEKKEAKMELVYWIISVMSLLFIFAHYRDLSYFISPYYVQGYIKFLPDLAAFGITAAVTYLLGIMFILKRKENMGRAEKLV